MTEVDGRQAAGVAEEGLESVEDFLAERGIESLADAPVMGHDGKSVPLAEALASCRPARDSIDDTIATIKAVGGPEVDVTGAIQNHLTRMSERADATSVTPQPAGAEKK